MILFIKHIDIEGPGTLGAYFSEKGFSTRTVDLACGGTLPETTEDLEAVISLGGPMNAYEEEKYPFLKEENDFIKKIIRCELPFMGICLGSQLLAKAAGAEIVRSPQKEIGFSDINLNDEGKMDPLFQGLGGNVRVFQWHEDMSMIPSAGKLMASSENCPHQAFRVGRNAYGLQFHVEITDVSIRQWCDKYIKTHEKCASMKEDMLKDYQGKKQAFDNMARIMYGNFEQVIRKVSS